MCLRRNILAKGILSPGSEKKKAQEQQEEAEHCFSGELDFFLTQSYRELILMNRIDD